MWASAEGQRGFYMAGQWAGGMLGTSVVAAMARRVVAEICRAEGHGFRTGVPG